MDIQTSLCSSRASDITCTCCSKSWGLYLVMSDAGIGFLVDRKFLIACCNAATGIGLNHKTGPCRRDSFFEMKHSQDLQLGRRQVVDMVYHAVWAAPSLKGSCRSAFVCHLSLGKKKKKKKQLFIPRRHLDKSHGVLPKFSSKTRPSHQ